MNDVFGPPDGEETREFSVGAEEEGMRLDAFLRTRFASSGLQHVRRAIESGAVFVGEHRGKKGLRLRAGVRVRVHGVPEPSDFLPQGWVGDRSKLELVLEDDDIMVFNKRAGMACHPLREETRNSLANHVVNLPHALSFWDEGRDGDKEADWSKTWGHARRKPSYRAPIAGRGDGLDGSLGAWGAMPKREMGLVHRLDTDTTGLVMFAKHIGAARRLRTDLLAGMWDKRYLAVCAWEDIAAVMQARGHDGFTQARKDMEGHAKPEAEWAWHQTNETPGVSLGGRWVVDAPMRARAGDRRTMEVQAPNQLQVSSSFGNGTSASTPRWLPARTEILAVHRCRWIAEACVTETEPSQTSAHPSTRWAALVELRVRSGRRHQVRAHMASIGAPLLGDVLYGGALWPGLEGHFLHASRIVLSHPRHGARLDVRAPIPPPRAQLLATLGASEVG